MAKRKTKLQLAQEQAEAAITKTNEKIDELGLHTGHLYEKLNVIQVQFDAIRNVPSEKRIQYEQLKQVRLNWKQQADKIETDFKAAAVKNAGGGVAGVGVGVAVAALGPTAAMGIATTFGVASTGTAISALSGAAATNAALAWLGGGALAAGGGGMAAGNAFLALAGPIGWAIAGAALLGSGLFLWKAKKEKEQLENIFTLVSKRDVKSYDIAVVELNERITHILNESNLLDEATKKIQTFGIDYDQMTEEQQYVLGSYVNLMEASTQLLVNPVMGLLPKYTEEDFNAFVSSQDEILAAHCEEYRDIIIALTNLFYKIKINKKEQKLLAKSFKKNKEFLSAMKVQKKDFDDTIMYLTDAVLQYKYSKK